MSFVNVIIPTFCPGNYLYECLKSLSSQSFSDFVCTIVLNGPEEPYLTQINQWIAEQEMSNVTILYSPVKGVSAARNLALDNNKSDYVIFLDDDDLINQDYLKNLYDYADKNCIIAVSVVNFQGNDTTAAVPDYQGREFREKNITECSPQQCPSVFSSCCGKVLPAALIGNRRFNNDLTLGEDSVFMYNVLASPVKKVVFAKDAKYFRRIRINSASRTKYSLGKIFRNRFKLAYLFSTTYFSNISKMSFTFYVRRIVAIFTKGLVCLLRRK